MIDESARTIRRRILLTPAMSSGTVLAAYAPARTAGRTQLEATVMRRGKLRKVHVAFAAATVLGQGVGWIARHDPDRRSIDRGRCG